MTSLRSIHVVSIFVIGLLLAGILVWWPGTTSVAVADASDDVRGYAWSENIGWISMNSLDGGGANYGVNVLSTGEIEGYAWSENIGWVSFNAAEVSGCGVGPRFDFVTSQVTGWARALSPTGAAAANAGGWDGCISLSNGSTYGITVDASCAWNGWAWGSDVVGWINFNGSGGTVYGELGSFACALPDLEVSGAAVTAVGAMTAGVYDTVTLTYQLINSGTAPADPSNTLFEHLAASGGPVLWSTTIAENSIAAGASSPWHTVTLNNVDFNGGELWIRISADDPSPGAVLEMDETNNASTYTFTMTLPDPNVQISASPDLVRYNSSATINWRLDDYFAMDCTIKGPQLDVSFSTDGTTGGELTGSEVTGALTSKGMYRITCVDSLLGTGEVFSAETTIEVIPKVQEN